MDKRKATIEKIVGVKISLGNFETLEVREGITLDVEYSDHDELEHKDVSLTNFTTKMLKQSVEQVLLDMGRQRSCKGRTAALWANTDQESIK